MEVLHLAVIIKCEVTFFLIYICKGHKVPVLARIPPITYQNYSTSVTESAQDVVEEPPGMFKRFWRWLSDSDDMDTEVCV